MSETTTTEWKSAFSYDNVDHLYSDMFRYGNNLVFVSEGQYYAVSSTSPFGYQNGSVLPSVNNTAHIYDPSRGLWVASVMSRPAHFDDFHVIAQDMYSTSSAFFSTADLRAGLFPAPAGSSFDSIYVDSVLSEVTGLLPVVVPLFVLYVGIRKGIRFLVSLVSRG